MVPTDPAATLDPRLALSAEFAETVRRHADGIAAAEDVQLLRANEKLWIRALYRLLDDIAESVDDVRVAVRGRQRAQVIADLEGDYRAVEAVLTTLVGSPRDARGRRGGSGAARPPDAASQQPGEASDVVELQLSWMPGRVVAWAAGRGGDVDGAAEVLRRLHDHGAVTIEWSEHRPVMLGGGARADAVSARIDSCLGWLVALGGTASSEGVGASVSWLGLVAASAVRLVAQGRMVPQLKKLHHRQGNPGAAAAGGGKGSASAASRRGRGAARKQTGHTAGFGVRWVPALAESSRLAALADSLPGAAAAFENQRDAAAFTQAVLADVVHAIAVEAAGRLDWPAPPPEPSTRVDVAEAVLARFDGSPFEGPSRYALELGRRLDQWHRPVRGSHDMPVIVRLSPPDETGSWQLSVLSQSTRGELQPVESALLLASRERKMAVKHQLVRLERLCPELLRLGGRRRGEVLLSPDEAWSLMTQTGLVLEACGYDLRVPELSRRRPKPALRITALDADDSEVGADQLANVRWSVVVDDVELSAEDIRGLAQQARPLVRSRGRWVELDRSDVNATVQALEERATTTRMTGVEMLRHALGLEGSPLPGATSIAGRGWAADLIRSAREIPDELPVMPEGFRGRLRNYQADALVWLRFLEQAGMGGCLALDMGLGKTPVMLAHIRLTRDNGPSLVVAPPAVVGNWLSEARRFVPELRVSVHHGPGRCPPEGMPTMVERTDLVITTYGTALRDIDTLERIQWSTIVADEAQAIKNHNSETARQLRRLCGRSRVTLTGTPIENGLGDLWAIMDFCNPGLLGMRSHFIGAMNTIAVHVGADAGHGMDAGSGATGLGLTGALSAGGLDGASADHTDDRAGAGTDAVVGRVGAGLSGAGVRTGADAGRAVEGVDDPGVGNAVRAGIGVSRLGVSGASGLGRGGNGRLDSAGRDVVGSGVGDGRGVAVPVGGRPGSGIPTDAGRGVPAADSGRPRRGPGKGEGVLAALNGLLVFRRTKSEPVIAAELPDRIDEVDHCTMTREQIGLYQAVLDQLVVDTADSDNTPHKKGAVLAAITALKQICNHPVNYRDDSRGVGGRSGKLTRLEEILGQVFAMGERALIFTHFATWGERLAGYLSESTDVRIACYHGGLPRGARDRLVDRFQKGTGPGAMVLSLKAGGTGLNLTAANHVVLYDRWWNPAVEDQARDRAWRIGQRNTVVCHRLVCPGTVDERVEKIVAGKRHIADIVLPKSSSIGDLDGEQLQAVLGLDDDQVLIDDCDDGDS